MTDRRASLHLGIFAEPFAALSAPLADLGARLTKYGVQIGIADHKIGARLTNLRAVQEQPQMRTFRVLATSFEAISDRLQAKAVAIQAVFNALFDLAGDLRGALRL